jgi:dynein heavy chain
MLRGQLSQVEMKISELRSKQEAFTRRKEELERTQKLCNRKLERANLLLSKLGGEKGSWQNKVAELNAKHATLVGDMLLASAMMAYLGPFPARLRQPLVTSWVDRLQQHGIPHTPDFHLSRVLGDASQTQRWVLDGLPSDPFTIENALIVAEAASVRRFPLLIDTQHVGARWIRTVEHEHNLVVLSPRDQFVKHLQLAVQLGLPCLLEGVSEHVPVAVEPLLQLAPHSTGTTIERSPSLFRAARKSLSSTGSYVHSYRSPMFVLY